ncbi:sushi, von Willebrand factor type A, EGF and pentraxin domain-containing protein 1-like isoform X2 [Bolinopsis microptera]|uniref:sushi, von Willebrand factor type A, EGF and pentraxin domain-containing protein 1-like isoform X2 n=1 Tax=Bolinopsis microptera TaxID=2820187 RepID=UPI00307A3B9F
MTQYRLFLLLAVFTPSAQGKAVNCAKNHKSSCPQSTFTTVQEGDLWKCPNGWLKTNFTSERWDFTLNPVDTSNLTAEVTFENNITSINLCSVTPKKADNKNNQWPSGGYCVPSPTNKKCPSDMVRVNATVTADGRYFKCSDAKPSPMSKCGNGTFDINACCPKNMSTTENYLDVPMYDIAAFYLLKTNSSCPQLYSFISSEESVFIDRANISQGPGEYFANTTNGTLKITFCRYANVKCQKNAVEEPFEQYLLEDACGRFETPGCKGANKVQPGNKDGTFDRYCLPNGNYFSESFCGAQCPAPPSIKNGTISPNTNSSLVEVTVQCNDGCYVEGPSSSTCQRNGTWSVNLANSSCKYAECKKSDLPQKGVTKWKSDATSSPFVYGHNVTFFCDRAGPTSCYYLGVLAKNVSATCQANGTWNYVPKCKVGRNCVVPGNTTTATHLNSKTKLRCESTVEYTCNPHRLSLADKMTLTCRSDGTFDVDPPNCTTVYCDNPALNITHGEVEHIAENGTVAGKFLEKDILRYDCDPMYRLVGDEVIACGDDGSWNGTTDSHCELIVCPMAPLKIPHGARIDGIQNQTVYHLGDEVEYQCEQGDEYNLNYSDPISCTNDGTWNPYIPSCNLVSCDQPPTVFHSITEPGPFPLHSNYSYTCEKGYKVSAESGVLTCEIKDGVLGWQGTPPTCSLVQCGELPEMTNGNYTTEVNKSVTLYPYNTQYQYTCEEGYNATLIYSTNCSDTGDWAPAPGCLPVQCRRPDVAYVQVNDSRPLFDYHNVVNIRCDTSRVFQPPQDLLCAEDGIWKVITDSENKEIISCHEPVHSHENKWTFVGVGGAMFLVLVLLLIVFVIKKKRRDNMMPSPYHDKQRFSVNPAYRSDENELTGFNNPTYEDNEPESFRIDRTASKGSRLVLRAENANEPQQYDTLRGIRSGGGGSVIEEPVEGTYNTLSQLKDQELICEEEEDDPEDLYNVPVRNNTTTAKNHYSSDPSSPFQDITVDSDDYGDEEDVYNVPTLGRGVGMVEVNDLYNSVEAAQICGTPLETDFDNIIYDNI